MIRGCVKNGVVVLDDPNSLPEGTTVSVRPIKSAPRVSIAKKRRPTVRKGLMQLAGKATDLPSDAAGNVDHYLYGHPKKEPITTSNKPVSQC